MAQETKIIDITVNYSDALTRIAQLEEAIRKTTKSIKENSAATDEAKNKRAKEAVEIKNYRRELTELTREVINTFKTEQQQIGYVQKLEAEVANLTLAYKRLTKEQLDSASGQQVLQKLKTTRDELAKANEAYGNFTHSVGNYGNATRGIAISMGQIANELPNFAISARIGIMSLSNNIPMLIDNIRALNAQNAVLRAQGQPTASVFKTLASSIFSWQTLVAVGVSLFVAYGEKLWDWAKSGDSARKSIDMLNKAHENFLKSLKEGNGEFSTAVKSFMEVSAIVDSTSKGFITQKDAVDEYNKTFGKTNGYAKTFTEVQAKIKEQTPAYVQAMGMMSLANNYLAESVKLAGEAEALRADKTITRWQVFANDFKNLMNIFSSNGKKLTGTSEQQILEARKKDAEKMDKDVKSAFDKYKEQYSKFSKFAKENKIDIWGDEKQNTKSSKAKADASVRDFDFQSKIMAALAKSREEARDVELESMRADIQKKKNESEKYINYLIELEAKGNKEAKAKLPEALSKNTELQAALTESERQQTFEINRKWDNKDLAELVKAEELKYKVLLDAKMMGIQEEADMRKAEIDTQTQNDIDAEQAAIDEINRRKEGMQQVWSGKVKSEKQAEYDMLERMLKAHLDNQTALEKAAVLRKLQIDRDANQKRIEKQNELVETEFQLTNTNAVAIAGLKQANNQLLLENEQQYQNLLAEKGFTATEDEKQRLADLKLAAQNATQEVTQAKMEQLGAVFNAAGAVGDSIMELYSTMAGEEAKYSAFGKALALFNIALSTGEAIANGIKMATKFAKDPISLAVSIATTVATVVANIAKAIQVVKAAPEPKTPNSSKSSEKSTPDMTPRKYHTGGTSGYSADDAYRSQEITATLLKGERVLSLSQTKVFDNIVGSIKGMGGSSSITSGVAQSGSLIDYGMIAAAMKEAVKSIPPNVLSLKEFDLSKNRVDMMENITKISV